MKTNNESKPNDIKSNLLSKGLLDWVTIPSGYERAMIDGRGRKSLLSICDLIKGLVYHSLQKSTGGSVCEHMNELHGSSYKGSTISQRRSHIKSWFMDLVAQHSLCPIAQEELNPECFYNGYRLVGIDGTKFDVPNSEEFNELLERHDNGGTIDSHYASLQVSTLVELGCHNPLSVSIASVEQETEYRLSKELYAQIPNGSLLIEDKLYGCPTHFNHLLEQFEGKDTHFLIPLQNDTIKYEVVEKLSDDSALIKMGIRKNTKPNANKIVKHILVRLVEVEIHCSNNKSFKLKLVTDLIDENKHPAQQLAALFSKRWEQEVYYFELKVVDNKGDLLRGKIFETCYQEIIALVLASHITAKYRLQAAGQQGDDGCQISYSKTKRVVASLWLTINLCQDILTEEVIISMIDKMNEKIAALKKPKKRQRTCPRVNHPHKSKKRKKRQGTKTIKLQTKAKIIPPKM